MFALLVTALICLETRGRDTKQIFADEKAPASSASMGEGRTLEARYNELAGEFKLTPREVEDMMYLYRGRTSPRPCSSQRARCADMPNTSMPNLTCTAVAICST